MAIHGPMTDSIVKLGTFVYHSLQDLPTFSTKLRTFHINLAYHLYSIWLFTFSDIKTIILPSFAFALCTAFAAPVFAISPAPHMIDIFYRAPLSIFWIWINLLPFAIDNQRRPAAIAEDLINKPWRTMPMKRMTPSQARTMMVLFYLVAVSASLRIGGSLQCFSLVALGCWYNGMKGADEGCLIRNLINACGFNQFMSGAFQVLLGDKFNSSTTALRSWLFLIAAVVFTSVQTQDMYDQEGDSIRGRHTVPIVYGDILARWSIAVAMSFWCFFCPWYMCCPPIAIILSVTLGGSIAARTLTFRNVSDDKMTFRLWNLWMVNLYTLPLWKMAEIIGISVR